ncbi:hypothetical protein INR49_019935 [Caranx melampygus]|nr:hypothetical protein INR49_019935 [Caranx melampygus]
MSSSKKSRGMGSSSEPLLIPHSDTVLVKFTDKIHGWVARYVSPLSRGQHLSTVLIIIGIVRLSFPPFAESGHGRAIHVGENTLSVQVMNANVDSAQACLGNVSCNGRVGSLILGHGQVPSPRLTVELSVGVALVVLGMHKHFLLCGEDKNLPDTGSSELHLNGPSLSVYSQSDVTCAHRSPSAACHPDSLLLLCPVPSCPVLSQEERKTEKAGLLRHPHEGLKTCHCLPARTFCCLRDTSGKSQAQQQQQQIWITFIPLVSFQLLVV